MRRQLRRYRKSVVEARRAARPSIPFSKTRGECSRGLRCSGSPCAPRRGGGRADGPMIKDSSASDWYELRAGFQSKSPLPRGPC